MYRIRTFNKISPVGLNRLDPALYTVSDSETDEDAILVRSAKLLDYDFPKNLLAIARAGAGVNNIPLDRCSEAGIVVFNTPGANANAVKELVLCAMLMGSRDVDGGIQWVRQQAASGVDVTTVVEKGKSAFTGPELYKKALGVIGLGAIGSLVANIALSLGMDVYGYDPFISVNGAWMLSRDVKHIMSVDTIYQECDYITIHVPATPDTKGMINQEKIAEMKDGVIILNFARDVLVNDADMAQALESDKVARYVSDFPNPTTAGKEGVILIPHLGASTEEAEDNCAVMAVQEISDYMENGNIAHSVNYPDCNMGVCQAAARIAVLHHNNKGVIAKYSTILGDADINVSDMTNKSRDQYAYTLLDLEARPTPETIEKLKGIKGILRVREVK